MVVGNHIWEECLGEEVVAVCVDLECEVERGLGGCEDRVSTSKAGIVDQNRWVADLLGDAGCNVSNL